MSDTVGTYRHRRRETIVRGYDMRSFEQEINRCLGIGYRPKGEPRLVLQDEYTTDPTERRVSVMYELAMVKEDFDAAP